MRLPIPAGRADALIADVTNNNPNVMFELGFADALGKPIIVLNQAADNAPFDIRNWRQISYTPDNLRAIRDRLTDFMTGILLRAGFARRTIEAD